MARPCSFGGGRCILWLLKYGKDSVDGIRKKASRGKPKGKVYEKQG